VLLKKKHNWTIILFNGGGRVEVEIHNYARIDEGYKKVACNNKVGKKE
jgi:hypothetical protein